MQTEQYSYDENGIAHDKQLSDRIAALQRQLDELQLKYQKLESKLNEVIDKWNSK